jgi:NAD(P)H-flavin reductase
MNTTYVTTEAARQHDVRAQSISLMGPLIAAAGLVWAILQPDRITLLHPRGQGFWWLAVEPPLYLVAAGIVFAVVVARPLLAGLERHRATTR